MNAAAPRLYCDQMLASLARWLRAAGYDTRLAQRGTDDRALVDQCIAEGRILLSRDRHLVTHYAHRVHTRRLADALDAQARQLAGELGIDWLRAPFTRCLLDNTPLRPATPAECARMPPRARGLPGPVRTCPCCERLYWPGSHVRRMQARLEAWSRGTAPGTGPDDPAAS